MMKKIPLLLLLLLPACEELATGAHDGAAAVRNEAFATKDTIKSYLTLPPYRGEGVRRAVPPSYCYKYQTDIVCYRQPRPDLASRLVAAQPVEGEPIAVTISDPVTVENAPITEQTLDLPPPKPSSTKQKSSNITPLTR